MGMPGGGGGKLIVVVDVDGTDEGKDTDVRMTNELSGTSAATFIRSSNTGPQ